MPRLVSTPSPLSVLLAAASISVLGSCDEAKTRPFQRDAPSLAGEDNATHASGVHRAALTIDSTKREFSCYVPKTLGDSDGDLPIVIYLHGHGDNMRHILGEGRVKSASSVWMTVAEREKFLVLYPLGAKGEGRRAKTGWNDCRTDADGNPDVDDVKFVRQLVDFAAESLGGDRKRVYVTGMSNGGHMTMRVAMQMSDEVAAVAPVAALLPKSSECAPPATPVPILMMNGTKDPLAPFNGGTMAGNRGEVMSARAMEDTWVSWNKLDDVPVQTVSILDRDPDDDSTIVARVRERSPDGKNGNAVVAYEIRGRWPH